MFISLILFSIKFLFVVVLTETVTNIVSKSGIFLSLREFLDKHKEKSFMLNYFNDLITCPYCFSVWAAWFSVIVLDLNVKVGFLNPYLGYFLIGLVVHRMSNILHHFIDRVDSKYYIEEVEDLLETSKIKGFDSSN